MNNEEENLFPFSITTYGNGFSSLLLLSFFFCRQKKNQKDRRPTPIKSTLLTKNFITRYRSNNKILLTFQAVFYRRVKGRGYGIERGIFLF